MKKAIILTVFVCFVCLSQAQTSKSFEWVAWKNVTLKTKAELKKIKADKDGGTAYDNIIETLEEGCDIQVAVLDMDGDGKMEYAVGSEGRYCCGSHGCLLTVYMDSGKKQIHLTDEWLDVKPAKNGVISTKGVLIKFLAMRW